MRNIVITAAILAGLGVFMAQMANKFTPASASTAPARQTVALAAPVQSGQRSLNIPRDGRGHFATEGRIDGQRIAFMVDTGATRLSIGLQMLADSKASYRVTEPQVEMVTSDGRRILAQGIVIESLQVGPFELRDVPAVACRDCKPLLGESVLSRFDLQSTRVQGVEFMSLAPRAHAGA